jgi:malate dehydrogenase (oxaloacetate-decarboxylating)
MWRRMDHYDLRREAGGRLRLRVPFRGAALLAQPLYNKSTAFTHAEREAFGLTGLLPEAVSSMEQQARRAYGNLARKTEALERYIGLAALQDRNETLFYRVLLDHLEELLPVVYTPTVGRACQEFSRIFRRARGLWITPAHRGRIEAVLADAPFADVRLIVVTDNESILGLGDQGVGGMAIPVGKLALYSAAAGIHPALTLPVSLDVGTDNAELLGDNLYLGWRHPRLRGAEYDSLVDEFVHAVRRRFPRALLQWEDFRKGTAFALLDRYRGVLPSFNDDVEGTGAMALAGLLAAERVAGRQPADERVVIVGAGAAGLGIGLQVHAALRSVGIAGRALREAVALVDLHGLVVDSDAIEGYQRPLAWEPEAAAAAGLVGPHSLLDVVRALRPTALIGVSGAAGIFSEAVVRAMAEHVERPAIFPLSNPTSQAEAVPADLVAWTGGRALIATGSPFPPVIFEGRTLRIGQGNNAFVFPGLGLGALVSEARAVTSSMFRVAAQTLAGAVSAADLEAGALFPPIGQLRPVTAAIAEAVVRTAREDGVGSAIPDAGIPAAVAAAMWEPAYPDFEPA